MSKTKIFISSTCYDLGQLRRDLESFIRELGHEPVLSDSDTAIPTGLSNVDACKYLVRSADLFLLVIGGRYGSEAEEGKSITNVEYETAFDAGMPIFAFVSQPVWQVRGIYNNLREMRDAGEISEERFRKALGPAVEDIRVFGFIDQVSNASRDSWVKEFSEARQIIDQCKADWSLLLRDLLRQGRGAERPVGLGGRTPRLCVQWAELEEDQPLLVAPLRTRNIDGLVRELESMRPLPEEVELVTRFKAEIERHLLFSESPKLSFPKGHGVSPFLNHASRIDRLLGLAATDPEGLVRRLDLRRRCVQPPIAIGNDGTAPANDIVVRIAKADRVCFLADDDLADENLWMPSPTKAHEEIVELARRFESGELESKRWPASSLRETPLPFVPFVQPHPGPPPPSVSVRDGDLVLAFPRKLQHGSEFVMTLDDLWIVPDLPAGEERQLRYECRLDDMPRPVHGVLRVVASEECLGED